MCVCGIGMTPMLARPCGKPLIVSVGRMPCAMPRYSVSVPIVTASDGRPRRVIRKPLNAPRIAPSSDGGDHRGPDRPAVLEELGHAEPGEAEHRSDGKIDLSGDDDQRERKRDDRDLADVQADEEEVRRLEEVGRDVRAVGDRRRAGERREGLPAHEAAEAMPPGPVLDAWSPGSRSDVSHELSRVASAGATRSAISRSKAIAARSKRSRECHAPERGDVHDDQCAVDRVQEERAESRAEDSAAAAEDRHAADDDCRDDLELVADAGDRIDRGVQRQPERSGHPGDPPLSTKARNTRSRREYRRAAPRRGRIRSRRSRAPYGSCASSTSRPRPR